MNTRFFYLNTDYLRSRFSPALFVMLFSALRGIRQQHLDGYPLCNANASVPPESPHSKCLYWSYRSDNTLSYGSRRRAEDQQRCFSTRYVVSHAAFRFGDADRTFSKSTPAIISTFSGSVIHFSRFFIINTSTTPFHFLQESGIIHLPNKSE